MLIHIYTLNKIYSFHSSFFPHILSSGLSAQTLDITRICEYFVLHDSDVLFLY